MYLLFVFASLLESFEILCRREFVPSSFEEDPPFIRSKREGALDEEITVAPLSANFFCTPQHFLNFFPEPQLHRSFLPIFSVILIPSTINLNQTRPILARIIVYRYSISMEPTKSIEKQIPTRLEKRIESLVRKALYTHKIGFCSPIAVALSGGKDSLTMLYFLMKIKGYGIPDLQVHALYVDGQFSCGPAITKKHLETFCNQLDVPLHVLLPEKELANLECYSCSRQRRTLLFKKAKELGCKEIAFGHHKDDTLESLLLNLLQKGEFGSSLPKVPMHDYGITIVRPLYYVLEAEILTFAQQKGFFRLTCQCPVGATSRRRDAKHLLQALVEEFPNTKANLFHALLQYGSDKSLKNG